MIIKYPPSWINQLGIEVKNNNNKKKIIKELKEGDHQQWSLRLNLTQHGKTNQVQT